MTLDTLPLYKDAYIKRVDPSTRCYKRLLEMGFVPRTKVTPLLTSLGNTATAYRVRYSSVVLRRCDAKTIEVDIIREEELCE